MVTAIKHAGAKAIIVGMKLPPNYGAAYVRHCIDATHTIGAHTLMGPMYAAVGRTWQMTSEERERDLRVLVAALRELAEYAAARE